MSMLSWLKGLVIKVDRDGRGWEVRTGTGETIRGEARNAREAMVKATEAATRAAERAGEGRGK